MANEYTVERIAAEIVADTRDAVRALTAMEANLERLAKDRTANVDINLSDSDVKKTDAELEKLTRDREVDVEVELNKRSMAEAKGELSRFQKEALSLGRMKLGGEFLSGLLKIPAALQGISVAASGIGSLAGGAAALAGSLQQMSTAALAAPAAITPLVGLMGSLKIATMGVKEASKEYFKVLDNPDAKPEDLEKLEKQFNKLSGQTVQAIKSASAFRSEMQILSAQLQQPLFGTLNREMDTLREMFQKIQPGMLSITQSFSDGIRSMVRDLNSPETDFTGRFTEVLQNSRPMVLSFSRMLTNLADVFLRLAETATPFVTKFVRALEGMSARARGVVQLGQYTGELSDKFEEAFDTGQTLMKSLSNLGRGLMNVFKGGADTGNEFLDSLEKISAKFLAWTQSVDGQNSIKKYFDEIKPPLKEAALLLGDLGKMFFKLDEAGRGPLTNILKMLRTDLLPTIQDILESEAGSGFLETMISGLSSLAKVFATLKGSSSALTSTMGIVVDFINVLGSLLDAIGPLAPAIGNLTHTFAMLRVVGVNSPIALGLAAITSLMTVLTGDARNATPIIAAFGAAWASIKVAQLIGQFQQLSSGIGTAAAAMQMLGGAQGAGGAAQGTSKLVGALGGGGGMAAAGGLTAATAGVAAAVAVAVAGLTIWQQNTAKAAADTDAMTAAVQSLETAMADGVSPTKEMQSLLGEWVNSNEMTDDLNRANVSMEELFTNISKYSFKLDENADGIKLMNTNHVALMSSGNGVIDMFDGMNNALGENFRSLRASGSEGATTARNIGHWADKMKDAYNEQLNLWQANDKISESFLESTIAANTNAEGFIDMNAVAAELAAELGVGAEALDSFNDAQEASAVKALQWQQALEASTNMAGLFGDALNANFGAAIGAKLKLAEMTDGYKALTDSIKEAKDKTVEGLTTNTQVLTQFGNMRSGAIEFARGMVEAGFSVEQASGWLKSSFLPALDESMRAAGLSTEQIAQLREQLGLVDGQIDISVQVYKDELAKLKLTEVYEQLKLIDDETFIANVEPLLEQGKLDEAQALINAWVSNNQEKKIVVKGDLSQWDQATRQVLSDLGVFDAETGLITIDGDISSWTDDQLKVMEDLGIIDSSTGEPVISMDKAIYDAASGEVKFDLTAIDTTTATPTVDANTNPFDTKHRTTTLSLFGLNGLSAFPIFNANNTPFTTKANITESRMGTLSQLSANPNVNLNTSGFDSAYNSVMGRLRTIGATVATAAARLAAGERVSFPGLADGGIIGRFAQGGMLPKQAKIQKPAGARGLVQWAETETKGEAFIPLASSKRKRSREIWMKTGQLLGIPVSLKDMLTATPMADGGIYSLGPGSSDVYNSFMNSSIADKFKEVEKVLTAMGGTKWKDFMTMITAATQQGKSLAAVGAVLSQYDQQTAFFRGVQGGGAPAAGPSSNAQAAGLAPYQQGIATWLRGKGKELLGLRSQGDYQTNEGNREFTHALLKQLQGMGAVVTETGYGEFDIDLSSTTNDSQITALLDRLSTVGFGVSESSTRPPEPAPTGPPAPYVLIQNAVFQDESDATIVGKKVEFAVRSERLE